MGNPYEIHTIPSAIAEAPPGAPPGAPQDPPTSLNPHIKWAPHRRVSTPQGQHTAGKLHCRVSTPQGQHTTEAPPTPGPPQGPPRKLKSCY